jgi:hypothetical protein
MRLMNLHTGVTRFLGLSELIGARVVHFSRLPDQPDRVGFNKRNLPSPQCALPGPASHGMMVQYADNRKRFVRPKRAVTPCSRLAGPTRPHEIDCQLYCDGICPYHKHFSQER